MPKHKKPTELQEGQEAYENFRRLASRLVRAPRRTPRTVEIEETTVVVDEIRASKPRKRKRTSS